MRWAFEKEFSPVFSSILDYPRRSLDPLIWNLSGDHPRLLSNVREKLVYSWVKALEEKGYRNCLEWMKDMFFVGGSATKQYRPTSDIDIHVMVDWDGFREEHGSKEENDVIREGLVEVAKELNDRIKIGQHPVQYFVDQPEVKQELSDAVYSLLEDKWIQTPVELPRDYNPVARFGPELEEADKVAEKLDPLIGDVRRGIIELKNIQEVSKEVDGISTESLGKNQEKIQRDIDKAIEKIIEIYEELREKRHKLYEKLREEGVTDPKRRLAEPEVVFKALERTGYIDLARKLKDSLPLKESLGNDYYNGLGDYVAAWCVASGSPCGVCDKETLFEGEGLG